MRTFKIDDIVTAYVSDAPSGSTSRLLRVSGVIHDERRLFVTDDSGKMGEGREFEVPFSGVLRHWTTTDVVIDPDDPATLERTADAIIELGDLGGGA